MTLHESDTSHWGLFATITEFFFGNGYFWNISMAKIRREEVCSYPSMLIPNFGVSTTIFIPVNIFCRWYKLNFGLLQDQVKSYHFYERIEAKRQYFYFLYIFLGEIGWKRHWAALLDIDLDSLLSSKWHWIRLTPE